MANPNALPTWGNESTMNLNALVHSNIMSSPYFRGLYDKKTYHEVLAEITKKVDSLEPFMKGTVASTAFCLLYKLWTLRLTVKQIQGMLDKADNGHIRALGLLYLRYTLPPAMLFEWFEGYLEDAEEVKVERGPPPRSMTIGHIAYTLLTSQKWLGSMLPRIPVPVAKDLETKLRRYKNTYSDVPEMDGPRASGPGGRPDTRFPPGTKAAGSGMGAGDRADREARRERSRDRDRGRDDRGGRYDDRRDDRRGDDRGRYDDRRYDDRRGDERGRYDDRRGASPPRRYEDSRGGGRPDDRGYGHGGYSRDRYDDQEPFSGAIAGQGSEAEPEPVMGLCRFVR
ncbi:putative RNA binding protein [Hyaloraphidium curvatum]|nr:putative RNA binding protein [Hyaloraphidium curvatum]